MAFCNSMLARRVVLWYILLGTFVILPLSFNVGLGCRFLDVNVETSHGYQSFGPFNVAIYDPEARGVSRFLGCVDLSYYWEDETSNDIGFTALRISSAFMLGFVSLATCICVCLQCFSRHGKTHWWGLMRFCYVGATISQGAMYTVYVSDMCSIDSEVDHEGKHLTQCRPGTTGVIGVFNFILLCGMVIATFISLPPRNPVFQCWEGGDVEYTDESEGGSTSKGEGKNDDDSVMRKFRSLSNAENDSVSLFEGSRTSRRSKKSSKSMFSGKEGDDSASAAEKGFSTGSIKSQEVGLIHPVSEETSEASPESVKPNKKSKSAEIIVETVQSESVSTTRSSQSKKPKILPVVKNLFKTKSLDEKESIASDRSKPASVAAQKSVDENESFKKSENDIASASSKKSGKSIKTSSSKRTSKSAKSSDSKGNLLKDENQDVQTAASLAEYGLTSLSSGASGSTLEITNFVIQLIEMTELKERGSRVKLSENENQVEIIDEYPMEEGGEIPSSSSSDQIAVRTEYYDLGSRSTKEITHSDGSKTMVTTITVDVTSDSTTVTSKKTSAAPLEPPVELSRSAGSIESIQSSKYQVMKSSSSVTSYTRTRGNRNQLGHGDLCLSVATPSTKK